MEDLVGIIIYLIIAVVGVLAGIYRNKQKKRSQLSPPSGKGTVEGRTTESVETEFDPFSGLFEEEEQYLEEEHGKIEEEIKAYEQDETGEYYSREEQERTAETEAPAEDIYQKEFFGEGEAAFKETEDAIRSDEIIDIEQPLSDKEIIRQEQEDREHKVDEKEFDLKKAIIYSEILKRKYH